MKQLNSKKKCFPQFDKILVIQPIAEVYGEGNKQQFCQEIGGRCPWGDPEDCCKYVGFKLAEMSGIGMLVVVSRSKPRMKTDLLSFKRDISALLRSVLQQKITEPNDTGVRISETIRKRLHRAGMRVRHPAIVIPLTRNHIQARLK